MFSEWLLCKEFGWSWNDLTTMPERSYQAFLRITTLSQKKVERERTAAEQGKRLAR